MACLWVTRLYKHTDADSWQLIVDDTTNHISNTATYYDAPVNTANNTVSADEGILSLRLYLNFQRYRVRPDRRGAPDPGSQLLGRRRAMKRTAMLLALVALLFLIGSALAMDSANYRLDWYVVLTGGGGGPTDSTNYAANFTVGQSAISAADSASYAVGLGYWYGVGGFKIYLPLMLKNYG
jgi:hypothetical protein